MVFKTKVIFLICELMILNTKVFCEQTEATGGNLSGDEKAYCHFPFNYLGKTYGRCSCLNAYKPWCYVDGNFYKWGDCNVPYSCIKAKGGDVSWYEIAYCSFPFNDGVQDRERTCSCNGRDTPWCYVDEAGERWGKCHVDYDCIQATGGDVGTSETAYCSFPFEYEGVEYKDRCSCKNADNPWCYIEDAGKEWGTCQVDYECVTASGGELEEGVTATCSFPFTYMTNEYTKCTCAGHDQPWCYVDPDQDLWGNCDVAIRCDGDECSADVDNCAEHAHCSNIDGSFACVCNSGFIANGTSCQDIDECAVDLLEQPCALNERCVNTPGGFNCTCYEGFGNEPYSESCNGPFFVGSYFSLGHIIDQWGNVTSFPFNHSVALQAQAGRYLFFTSLDATISRLDLVTKEIITSSPVEPSSFMQAIAADADYERVFFADDANAIYTVDFNLQNPTLLTNISGLECLGMATDTVKKILYYTTFRYTEHDNGTSASYDSSLVRWINYTNLEAPREVGRVDFGDRPFAAAGVQIDVPGNKLYVMIANEGHPIYRICLHGPTYSIGDPIVTAFEGNSAFVTSFLLHHDKIYYTNLFFSETGFDACRSDVWVVDVPGEAEVKNGTADWRGFAVTQKGGAQILLL